MIRINKQSMERDFIPKRFIDDVDACQHSKFKMDHCPFCEVYSDSNA